jgi:phospholipid-translocating ATPase
MKIVSLCHECVSETNEAGKVLFKGPSPDEEALVEFARDLGFVFNNNSDQNIKIK